MTKNPISERVVRRAAAGDELATSTLYVALHDQFERTARKLCNGDRDPHSPEEAIEAAFQKTLSRRVAGGLAWQGEAEFCSYFKKVLTSTAMDMHRRRRLETEWTRTHTAETHVVDDAGGEEDLVELLPDPKAGVLCQLGNGGGERQARAAEVLLAFAQQLGPSGVALLSAYSDLAAIPGSDQWPSHERTGFVKARLHLDDNAFYVAHSRFRTRAKPFAEQLGLRLR